MLVAIIIKELQLLRRDPRAVVRLLILPIAFITLFGKVFDAEDRKASHAHPIAVWRDPAAAGGQALLDGLAHSTMYAPLPLASADAVRAAVAREDNDVGLVIPADFDPLHGHPAELVIDLGRAPAAIGPMIGSISAIAARAMTGGGEPPRVVVPTTPPGIKPSLAAMTSFQITVPGNSVLFGFFIALTCALSFAEERRTGTGRRLLAAPVARWKLLFAKLLPYIVLGSVQVGILFVIGSQAFGMQVGGSVVALAVLTIGVACCAAGLGLMIASVSTTEKQIGSLGSLVVLIMGLLGGCMIPRELMPEALRKVGLFVPHAWALDGYHLLLARAGTTIADVAPQIGAVYGFAVLFTVVGMWRFKFDP